MNQYVRELFISSSQIENISVANLSRFDKLVWVELNDGIKTMKLHEDEKVLVFLTKMEKGSSFNEHTHNDADEVCNVIYGILEDVKSKAIRVKGENMSFTRGVPHLPKAKTDTLLNVTFYKNY